jgi:H+/Cl- antiporter ClcA
VVWRYQLNAGAQQLQSAPSFVRHILPAHWSSFIFFVTIGVFLGFLGFYGLPRSFDSMVPYDKHLLGPSLFLFAFYIFINIHHYFLDNVMWRRGNPDVQQYLFAKTR